MKHPFHPRLPRRFAFCHLLALGFAFVLLPLPGALAEALSSAPQVVRMTGQKQPTHSSDAWVFWGNGLNPETLEMVSRDLPFEKSEAVALLEKGISDEARFPAGPPEGAHRLSVMADDGRGFVAATRPSRGSGIVWLRNGEGPWTATPVSRAQIWWASPGSPRVGETLRIFGRELAVRYRDNFVALRHTESGEVRLLERIRNVARHGFYEVAAKLPEDLSPGPYELFLHNATGGNGNWSRPYLLEILPPREEATERKVDAADHGAKGDGRTDDTQALRAALAEADRLGGATVLLDIGTYRLSGTLVLPEGVSLRGRGRELTRLAPLSAGWEDPFPVEADFRGYARDWLPFLAKPGHAPLIWMRNRSAVTDLSLSSGPGVGNGILVARAPGVAENLRIENLRIRQTGVSGQGVVFAGIKVMGDTSGFTVRGNEFEGVAITMLANRHEQFYFGYNRVRAFRHGFPLQAANLVFLRGTIRSIVEENFIENGDRNIVMQSGRLWGKDEVPEGMKNSSRTSYHTAWIGNHFLNNIPRRHNAGEIMFEGGEVFWSGTAETVEADRLTVSGAPFNTRLEENWVAVVDGKGIGQYRKITRNNDNTLELERPWEVTPDADSTLAVGNFVVEHLWIDNIDENTANWTGFWGSHFGHVIEGQINRGGEGLYLWAYDNSSVIGFVDIKNNWVANRGNIVLTGRGMVFGTTLAQNEVMDFYARPSQHGTRPWAHPRDERVQEGRAAIADRPGIRLSSPQRGTFYPAEAPARDWNLVIRNLIAGGPRGIVLESGTAHNFVNRNVLIVEREEVVDEGSDNLIGKQFGRDEAEERP